MADFILDKEEKESLIEHFRSLQIDNEKAGAQMDVQEQAPIQIPAKKTSKAPEKQLKITSFFKYLLQFFSENKLSAKNRPKFGKFLDDRFLHFFPKPA